MERERRVVLRIKPHPGRFPTPAADLPQPQIRLGAGTERRMSLPGGKGGTAPKPEPKRTCAWEAATRKGPYGAWTEEPCGRLRGAVIQRPGRIAPEPASRRKSPCGGPRRKGLRVRSRQKVLTAHPIVRRTCARPAAPRRMASPAGQCRPIARCQITTYPESQMACSLASETSIIHSPCARVTRTYSMLEPEWWFNPSRSGPAVTSPGRREAGPLAAGYA
jgi:hypothetical protein